MFFKIVTINNAVSQEIKQMMMFSAKSCILSRLTSPPRTFCVLMLLIRIGMSAMLKLVWFIAEINSTINAIIDSIVVVRELPLFKNPALFSLA